MKQTLHLVSTASVRLSPIQQTSLSQGNPVLNTQITGKGIVSYIFYMSNT